MLLWIVLAAAAAAQDVELGALHATLVSLHSQAMLKAKETRGATPDLTVAKHQLRDWIEKRLGSMKGDGDEKAFSVQINEALKTVGVKAAADDENVVGSLGGVRFSMEAGLLIVTTAVEILCQYDESAYAYRYMDGRWQRIWESEQNDYSPKKYNPQHIEAVHGLQPLENGPTYVMYLGTS